MRPVDTGSQKADSTLTNFTRSNAISVADIIAIFFTYHVKKIWADFSGHLIPFGSLNVSAIPSGYDRRRGSHLINVDRRGCRA